MFIQDLSLFLGNGDFVFDALQFGPLLFPHLGLAGESGAHVDDESADQG
ncbi:MAG: hypothetical protein GX597_22685 [Anaerolineaceae bacterium]|nr:hypothetical protein [Anaerolineaceae bacterium]